MEQIQKISLNNSMIFTPKPIDTFFYIWAIFLPITSILIIPSIQGTFPSAVFALMSLSVVVLTKQRIFQLRGYLADLSILIFIFLFLSLISQFINGMLDLPKFYNLRLVDGYDTTTEVFRSSYFTQSLYLLISLITFVFVKNFYNIKWDKAIFTGISLYVLYGLYEFAYYIIFKDFGDFLTNRNFGNHDTINLGNQLMRIGSIVIQRINGLALEPSMFAFTVLPFWIYATFTGRKKISFLLFIGLCLSTSTTAFLGIFIYLIPYIIKCNKLGLFYIVGFTTLIILINFTFVYEIINEIVLEKMKLETQSGADRASFFQNHLNYFLSLNVFSMLFGLGFGYVRSTDFLSTILVNNGIVGLVLFTLLFFLPIIKLKNNKRNVGLKISLFVIFITMMISVPEFSFASIWLFLGIAYKQMKVEKLERLN